MADVSKQTCLEKDDFLTFTLKVLTSTSKQRISFAARSRMHHKLLGFFLILITDSLDIVESDLDRTQFDMKEKRQAAAEMKIKQEHDMQTDLQNKIDQEDERKRVAHKKKEIKTQMMEKILAEQKLEEKVDDDDNSNAGVNEAPPPATSTTSAADTTEQKTTVESKLPPPSSSLPPPTVKSTQLTEYDKKTPEEKKAFLLSRLEMYTTFIWDKYDIDKDGSLNASEFETFLRVITQRGEAITSEDCSRFLRQMDRSGDGKLQRDELVEFAGNGFDMGDEEALEYSARSVMHALLVVFINKLKVGLSSQL